MFAPGSRSIAELLSISLQDPRELPDVLLRVHQAAVSRQRCRPAVAAGPVPRLQPQLSALRPAGPRTVLARTRLVIVRTISARHAM